MATHKPKATCVNATFHDWRVEDEYTERCNKCPMVIANRAWNAQKTRERHQYYRLHGLAMSKGGIRVRWSYNKMLDLLKLMPVSYSLYINPNGQLEGMIANSLYHLRYECGVSYQRIKKTYHLEDGDVDYFIMAYPYVHRH